MKKTYKIFALILAAGMLAVLPGCGQSAVSTEPVEQTSAAPSETPEPSPSPTQTPEPSPSVKVAEFWTAAAKALSADTDTLGLCAAQSFHEKRAWVTVGQFAEKPGTQFYEDKTVKLAIDTDGKVIYKCPVAQDAVSADPAQLTTEFTQGVSLVKTEDDQMLIGTNGKVVWSVSKNGKAEADRLFGTDSAESIELMTENNGTTYDKTLFSGYTLVKMHINTFDKAGDYYGVLKPDGSWVIEPSDSPITMDVDNAAYVRNGSGDYISLSTGEVTEDNATAQAWQDAKDREEQNGLLYDFDQKGFTDSSGSVVIDLSSYTLDNKYMNTDYRPFFYDGYCVLSLLNPGGDEYVTVIDTKGNRLFEPVKKDYESNSACGVISSGLFVLTGNSFYTTQVQAERGWADNAHYTDLKGKALPETYDRLFAYSDGAGLTMTRAGTGATLGSIEVWKYLDPQGKDLFPTE